MPVAFDTDVNAAALAEARWGAAHDLKASGLENILYITVGTGIGGGALVDGSPLHGLIHPEMGHIRIPHNRDEDPFPGACRFHGDCFEGLASGLAMELRWGVNAERLEADHPAWRLEAHYLAVGLANLVHGEELKKSAQEHHELLDLLADGQGAAADKLMVRHIGHVLGWWAGKPELDDPLKIDEAR